MDLELSGKTALVTGASSGIGAATARLLAAEGADVVVVYGRNRTGGEATAEAVRAAGRRAWLVGMDVASAESVQAAGEEIARAVPGIDAAVLSAGYSVITPIERVSAEEWRRVLDGNLSGAFYSLQMLIPRMRTGSSIVLVASVAGQTGAPHHAHYAAAKAGVINLAKSAARSLAPRVRVNCIAPGMTLTPMGADTARGLPPDYAQTKLLVGRFAQPEEIARAILFLASPVSGFITGATLDANGGRNLR